MQAEIVNSNITKAVLKGDYYEVYYRDNLAYTVNGEHICFWAENQCTTIAAFVLISQLVEACVHQFETKEFEDSLKDTAL